MNPLFIAHRINTRAELAQVPPEYGAEIDVRDYGNRLILQHDPFKDGEDLEEYLKSYRHRLIIFNIKSERIEPRVQELIKKYRIKDYFFLDSSFPMIYNLSASGEKNIAVRFSEFEGLDTVLALEGRVDWVWVDCFTKLPITAEIYKILRQAGFRLCLVSPELQKREYDIVKYRAYLAENLIAFDAVCTKTHNIAIWTTECTEKSNNAM
jgi:hypothetical protein